MLFAEYLAKLNKEGGFPKGSPPLLPTIKKEYQEATAHTRGSGLGTLLEGYRPAEHVAQKESRRCSLQAITSDAFHRATNMLIETISPATVTVSAPDDVAAYMSGSGYWYFLQSAVVPNMLDDPNGFLVSLPVPKGQQNTPDVLFWLVNYIDVKELGKDYLVFAKKTDTGTAFFFVSDGEAAKFVGVEGKFFLSDYYASWETSFLPYTQLKGTEGKTENNEKYWQSYYRPAFIIGTRAIQQDSDAEMMRKTANPLIVKKKEECNAKGCHRGAIYGQDGIDEGSECHDCGGTGVKRTTWNINEVIEVDSEDLEAIDVQKFVSFAMPPTDGVKLNVELAEKSMAKMEKALNLIFVDMAQSGTAKDIDREIADAMVNTIAKNVYLNIVRFCFDAVGVFFGEKQSTVIVLPNSFRKRTAPAILEGITTMKKEGVPTGVLYPEFRALYEKMYKENPKALRLALFMLSNDPLHMYQTAQEKRLAQSDAREFEYSKQLPAVWDRMAYTMFPDTFTGMTDAQIKAEVDKLIILPKVTPIFEEGE